MAYRIQPLPITDSLSALANPLVLQINAEGIITSAAAPQQYTKWLMAKTCTGESRIDVAIAAQRWILHETGQISLGPLFAWLSLLDILGRVDTRPLMEPMLQMLAGHTQALHNMVFLVKATDPRQLTEGAAARKASATSRYGALIVPYLTYLDRIVARLLPFMPQ